MGAKAVAIVLDDGNRWQALRELYSQTHREITRYRDMEWKVLNWTVLLLVGVIAVSKALPASGDLKLVLKVLIFLFTAVVAFYGSWHIHFIHRELTWNRNLRQKIEEIFEFHKLGVFASHSILNQSWLHRVVPYSSGLPHLVSWWLLIWLVAFYALFTIVTA